jgi:hypothetical protein
LDTELDQRLTAIFDGMTALAAGIAVLLRSLDAEQRQSAYRVLAHQRDAAADRPALARMIDIMVVDPSR